MADLQAALHDLQAGGLVILTDDAARENEGDLIVAAGKCTPEIINFMVRQACGLVCLAMPEARWDALEVPPMVVHNQSPLRTAFGVSIEATEGVTTGISAFDRARTVQVASAAASTAADLRRPGHIFPLRAKAGGVLERPGHTEGALALMQLADLPAAAVICEILREDGRMARAADLAAYAQKHKLVQVSIADVTTAVRATRKAFL